MISDELSHVKTTYLTPIKYLENELFVDSKNTSKTEFPVLLMDWVEGMTLDKYIKMYVHRYQIAEDIDEMLESQRKAVELLANGYELDHLAYQFSLLAIWLLQQPFAHGDLKPDNILVLNDGSLVLVDYDGMFVPAMRGQKARELGSPDFRHPLRNEDDFDEHIDDFPLSSILLSLLAISNEPSLLEKYGGDGRLLFSENDYRNIAESKVLDALKPLMEDKSLTTYLSLFYLCFAQKSLFKDSYHLFSLPVPEKPSFMKDEELEKWNRAIEEVALYDIEDSWSHNEEIYPGVFLFKKDNFWGCVDIVGNIIIPIKYDVISVCDCAGEKHIICGRDGKQYAGHIHKDYHDINNNIKTVYTGVYDLYSNEGHLKIGGFIEFKYNKEFKAYLFKFGHNYEYLEGNGTVSSPYRFKLPYGEWILLSSWFCFVKSYSYTYQKSLPSIFWITENNKSIEGSVLQYNNGYLQELCRRTDKPVEPIVISNEVLFDDIKFVNSTTILCKKGKAKASSYCIIHVSEDNYSRFSHPVFNGNTIISPNYKWVKILDEHYTFVYNSNRIGLLKDGRTVIPCDYSFITIPIDGWCFAAIKYPFIPDKETWNKYFVILCNVQKHRYDFIKREDIIIAIDNINEDVLKNLFNEGGFLLYKMKNEDCNISSFTVSKRYKNYFNQSFLHSLNQSFYEGNIKLTHYWLSSDSVKTEIENMHKQPEIHDTYSLIDALDGDPNAYWNID